MNYAEIKYPDIANGPGVRVSLFVSGCTFHCKGCFNEIAWDFDYGKSFTEEVENDILRKLAPSYVNGLTILGGEPLHPSNRGAVARFIRKVKLIYPAKTIWVYTGYQCEDLLREYHIDYDIRDILNHIEVLVDGQFEEDRRNISLRFRGSENQRLIDIPETLQFGNVRPWSNWQDWNGMRTLCSVRNADTAQK